MTNHDYMICICRSVYLQMYLIYMHIHAGFGLGSVQGWIRGYLGIQHVHANNYNYLYAYPCA